MKRIQLNDEKSYCLFKTYENLTSPKAVATLKEWYDFIIGNNIKNLINNEEDFIQDVLFNTTEQVSLSKLLEISRSDEYATVIDKLNSIDVCGFLISYRNAEGGKSLVRENCIDIQFDLENNKATITFDKSDPITIHIDRIEYCGLCVLEFVDLRENFKEDYPNEASV